jgi:hypothetical protein
MEGNLSALANIGPLVRATLRGLSHHPIIGTLPPTALSSSCRGIATAFTGLHVLLARFRYSAIPQEAMCTAFFLKAQIFQQVQVQVPAITVGRTGDNQRDDPEPGRDYAAGDV